MPNSRDSIPLTAVLDRILSFVESKDIEVPYWLKRAVNTAKGKIASAKMYKEKYVVQKEKYKKAKEERLELVHEIAELAEISEQTHNRIGNLNQEIENKNAEIANLEEEKSELMAERNGIDSFLKYIDLKYQKYFGIPQEEFLARYNRWAEARTRELEQSRHLRKKNSFKQKKQ